MAVISCVIMQTSAAVITSYLTSKVCVLASSDTPVCRTLLLTMCVFIGGKESIAEH